MPAMKLEWNEYHARLTDDAAIGDALPFRVVLFRTQYTARQRACCGVTYLDLVTVVYLGVSKCINASGVFDQSANPI